MKQIFTLLAVCACLYVSPAARGNGALTDNIRINSQKLGYSLQFRVYVPGGTRKDDKLPVIYVTDGQWYLQYGEMDKILDATISTGQINPAIVVFVDSTNPDNARENRRNAEFMCNADYATFYKAELVPTVEANFPVSTRRDDRIIMGVSFGGLNAACFGLMAPDVFAGIGMHSPANADHLKLLRGLYDESEALPLRMFFSVGTKNDNTKAARRFKRTLEKKGYDLTYMEVHEGHDWNNWRPLIDDLLKTFLGK